MPPEGTLLRRIGWGLLGLVASVPLHVAGLSIGMLAMVVLGFAPNGPWPQRTQEGFVLSFGLWQWLYLLPAVLLLRSRRPALAMGIGASAVFGFLLALAGLVAFLHRG